MISVIVPIYNVEKYLNDCVISILNQSYTDIEVILIDDGSTDSSGRLCDELLNKDARIKVIHKPNGGLSDARNAGIEVSEGSEICFIDSDDLILPGYLSTLHSLLVSNDADMSVCGMTTFDESETPVLVKDYPIQNMVIEGNYNCMKGLLIDSAIDTTAWRKLYRASLFKDTGIRYPVGRYHEDVWTTYQVIAHCNCIAVTGEKLYAYRKRKGSIVNSAFSPRHLDAVKGHVQRYDFVVENYPLLRSLASKSVIYSAGVCLRRISKSDNLSAKEKKYYLLFLHNIYRKYLSDYLASNAKKHSKLFAIASRLSPQAMSVVLKFFYNGSY